MKLRDEEDCLKKMKEIDRYICVVCVLVNGDARKGPEMRKMKIGNWQISKIRKSENHESAKSEIGNCENQQIANLEEMTFTKCEIINRCETCEFKKEEIEKLAISKKMRALGKELHDVKEEIEKLNEKARVLSRERRKLQIENWQIGKKENWQNERSYRDS